jgi:hypothetical protein
MTIRNNTPLSCKDNTLLTVGVAKRNLRLIKCRLCEALGVLLRIIIKNNESIVFLSGTQIIKCPSLGI